MIRVLKLFIFFLTIKNSQNQQNDEASEKINIIKRLDVKNWKVFTFSDRKIHSTLIKEEYKPFGSLYNDSKEIDFDYYNNICLIFIKLTRKILQRKELDAYIDEGLNILDEEEAEDNGCGASLDEDKNNPTKKIDSGVQNLTLEDFKTDYLYFYLLKYNIQLLHFNIFMFIVEHVQVLETKRYKFFIELTNVITGKNSTISETCSTKEQDTVVSAMSTTAFGTKVGLESEFVLRKVQRATREVTKENSDFFLSEILKNDELRTLLLQDTIKFKKKKTFYNVKLDGTDLDYYINAVKEEKRFKDLLIFLIRRKKSWVAYTLFFIFNSQDLSTKLYNFLHEMEKMV